MLNPPNVWPDAMKRLPPPLGMDDIFFLLIENVYDLIYAYSESDFRLPPHHGLSVV